MEGTMTQRRVVKVSTHAFIIALLLESYIIS